MGPRFGRSPKLGTRVYRFGVFCNGVLRLCEPNDSPQACNIHCRDNTNDLCSKKSLSVVRLMLTAILALILCLLIVVGLHEAGHALAARYFGVHIERFSIGFGPALLRWQSRSGIKWQWALWPLGGYVRLRNTRIQKVDTSQYHSCFDKKPIYQRTVILLSGVAMNLLIAFLAFFLVFYLGVSFKAPVIQSVTPQSLAEQAGLQKGMRIVSVDGQNCHAWSIFGMAVLENMGKKNTRLGVSSQHEKDTLLLDTQKWRIQRRDKNLLKSLGIHSDTTAELHREQASGALQAIRMSAEKLWDCLYFYTYSLFLLLSGKIPFGFLLGPISFFTLSGEALSQGVSVFSWFIAQLSLAVALVNILPIPGLDGGALLYLLIEKCRGKPVSVALEVLLYQLALIAGILLLFQIVLQDISQRFGG